ncbi:MAG: alanine--tRNA ligase [Candidatus Paceibacterota bacterium]|jgi:alanyl-tRNA synthetase
MSSEELRKEFLDFFKDKGHRIISSSSLFPENDPSVLFTTAGMQQFKLYYTGTQNPLKDNHSNLSEPLNNLNVATCQKCLRTTDIEAVGDESHLTFFEMLGNFSFDGYFKKEAIHYAWEFFSKVLKISLDRITISVFKGNDEIPFDKESYDIWLETDIPKEKIILGSKEDNFWGPTGNEGPCGPTTEIYVDGIEIWNLVFNEYYKHADQKLESLKIKGVDTGMGLERLALVMQYPKDKTKTIFDTSLFKDLIIYLKSQGEKGEERIYRIIADHFRAIVFLTAAGIIPSNTLQGYVLRRLLRRIIRFSKILNFNENWSEQAYKIIKENYSNVYPELENQKEILSVINQEKDKFEKTLENGLKEWQKLVNHLPKTKEIISGKDAFYLYESYGFPLEILEEMAKEINTKVDRSGFEEEFCNHQNISRVSQEKKFGGHGIQNIENKEDKERVIKLHTATHLLLQALRIILDAKIEQKGSDITPEKLRLDFPFPRKLTTEEIKKIENLINQKIKEDLLVHYYEANYEEAIRKGALGSFKDRYPEKVTIYEIKDLKTKNPFSMEICAGPHVKTTKEIGSFKILKEEAVGQGIRRIKATVDYL